MRAFYNRAIALDRQHQVRGMSGTGEVRESLTCILHALHLDGCAARYDSLDVATRRLEVAMNRCSKARLRLAAAAMLFAPAFALAQAPVVSESVRQHEAAREARQRVADIFDAMKVRPGAVVADVGAGGGFLTVRLARAVGGTGRVMAVDIDAQVLEQLRGRIDREALSNVEVIAGDEADPHLGAATLDAAVIVNAYHEMRAYEQMLARLREALKPDGRLVIVEPISEKRRHATRDALVNAHEIALPLVEDDVRRAGFRVARTEDPFTSGAPDTMWLLVAVPEASAATPHATSDGDDAARSSSPDLRMAFDRFKQLRSDGRIVVVDVRSEIEYETAHIPGAISIPLERLGAETERLRKLGKPIVTYCS